MTNVTNIVITDPPDYNGGAVISTYMLLMEVEKAGTKGIYYIANI